MASLNRSGFIKVKIFSSTILRNRWFSVFNLVCVFASIILWELDPAVGPAPLTLILLPWLFKLLAGTFTFQWTRIDLFLGIFVVTAWIGAILGIDQAASLSKLWLILGGCWLFYAFAGQPKENIPLIIPFLLVISSGTAVFFLATNDWHQFPAKIEILNQIGLEWMKIRPNLQIMGTHPNNAAGIIAFTLPFFVPAGLNACHKRRIAILMLISFGGCLACLGLVMATSRGAVLGLGIGFVLWFLFFIWNKRNESGIHYRPGKIGFLLLILVILIAVFLTLNLTFSSMVNDPISVFSRQGTRLSLFSSTVKLIEDFPVTGAGLSDFPGLFSTYILGIPFFYLLNSHNLFLDITLEQGIFGLIAFLWVYFNAIWLILSDQFNKQRSLYAGASLASLIIILVHGLVDNIIYDPGSAPLVFFMPGIVYGVFKSQAIGDASRSFLITLKNFFTREHFFRNSTFIPVVIISVMPLILYAFRQPLLSTWFSNLGAVKMAKVELAGFPTSQWDDGRFLSELVPAESDFLTSIQYNSANRTANHRLGLIAISRRDFQTAIYYLENAFQTDPGHRGIWKSLGYAYAWVGQFEDALPLLQKIPEARQEMDTYAWWWTTQNRQDLSINAGIMAKMLIDPAPQRQ